jgi:RNA-directed DNA polymerase
MTEKEMTKSLPIRKRMVWPSYQQVKARWEGAGLDKQTIDGFDANPSKNLYKLWNRLSSGSYFPPAVRTVFIPKKQGGARALGIPTVSDRTRGSKGVFRTQLGCQVP